MQNLITSEIKKIDVGLNKILNQKVRGWGDTKKSRTILVLYTRERERIFMCAHIYIISISIISNFKSLQNVGNSYGGPRCMSSYENDRWANHIF